MNLSRETGYPFGRGAAERSSVGHSDSEEISEAEKRKETVQRRNRLLSGYRDLEVENHEKVLERN